jgi:hypothetical protein
MANIPPGAPEKTSMTNDKLNDQQLKKNPSLEQPVPILHRESHLRTMPINTSLFDGRQ